MKRTLAVLRAYANDPAELLAGAALALWGAAGLWPTPDYALLTHFTGGAAWPWVLLCGGLGLAQVSAVSRCHFPARRALCLTNFTLWLFLEAGLLLRLAVAGHAGGPHDGIAAPALIPVFLVANGNGYIQTASVLNATSRLVRERIAALRRDAPGGD